MIVVFTGNGKGKTSAAIGIAARASGRSKRILFVQFVKGKPDSGEVEILKGLPRLDYNKFGAGFIKKENIDKHKKAAREGFEFLKKQVDIGKYDFIILDELNILLYYKLLECKEVFDYLRIIKDKFIIIITGRYAKDELIEIADIVTDMKNIKHIYDKGTRAIEGLDF